MCSSLIADDGASKTCIRLHALRFTPQRMAAGYLAAYRSLLADQAGISVAPQVCVGFENRLHEPILYILQQRYGAETIGAAVLGECTEDGFSDVLRLMLDAVLRIHYRNEIDDVNARTDHPWPEYVAIPGPRHARLSLLGRQPPCSRRRPG